MNQELIELLARTSLFTQITNSEDKTCDNPVAYGSGFFVEYLDTIFFVTAYHTVNLDDDIEDENARKNYRVSIFNNYSSITEDFETIVTPLNEFYYSSKFDLKKPSKHVMIDGAVSVMKKINFKFPFLNDERQLQGKTKLEIKENMFELPNKDSDYFIYGKIKAQQNGIRLDRTNTLKSNLKFILETGDYFLFNTDDIIVDKIEWEGLSGSAVISAAGNCVGILCSVNENSKSIFVLPIKFIKMLMVEALRDNNISS